MRHRFMDPIRHLVHIQLRDRPMQWRGSNERVDPRLFCIFHRIPTAINIANIGACQPADHRIGAAARDFADRAKITFRCDWKSRFDDINTHLIKQFSDF